MSAFILVSNALIEGKNDPLFSSFLVTSPLRKKSRNPLRCSFPKNHRSNTRPHLRVFIQHARRYALTCLTIQQLVYDCHRDREHKQFCPFSPFHKATRCNTSRVFQDQLTFRRRFSNVTDLSVLSSDWYSPH